MQNNEGGRLSVACSGQLQRACNADERSGDPRHGSAPCGGVQSLAMVKEHRVLTQKIMSGPLNSIRSSSRVNRVPELRGEYLGCQVVPMSPPDVRPIVIQIMTCTPGAPLLPSYLVPFTPSALHN